MEKVSGSKSVLLIILSLAGLNLANEAMASIDSNAVLNVLVPQGSHETLNALIQKLDQKTHLTAKDEEALETITKKASEILAKNREPLY